MPKAPPRPAAALVLMSVDGRALVSKRSLQAPFLGGFVAFVGGCVEPSDRALASALFAMDDEVAASAAAAVRELLEETGLLLAAPKRKGPLVVVRAGRRPASVLDAYEEASVEPPPLGALCAAGRFVTPEYAPLRFDTRFYLAEVAAAEPAMPDPDELDWAEFFEPSEVLARHRALELLLPRPTRDQLEVLAQCSSGEGRPDRRGATSRSAWVEDRALRLGALAEAEEDPAFALRGFEPAHGIWQVPLRTPTLPPATHTNCYIVGHERLVVIDPATYDEAERVLLLAHFERALRRGAHFEAVILTHHHADHVGAASFAAAQLGVPILAHPLTQELLHGRVAVDELLDEGDRLDLGHDETGEPFFLEVLHTPGHAPGHLVLADIRRSGHGLIVGDMVAAVGTIIVDPDEGDMAEYIAQLRRLRARPEGVVYPAHGPPIAAGRAKLDAYIAHRLEREEKIASALRSQRGPASARDLLPVAYADTPRAVWSLAERSCLAHLLKLVADGRAACIDGDFRALEP